MTKFPLSLQISERRMLLMVGDLFAIAIAILISLAVWALVGSKVSFQVFILEQIRWFVALPLLWFILAHANDFYNLRVAADLRASLMRLFQITLLNWIVYLGIYFLSPPNSLPRLFILYYGIISLAFIGLWRLTHRAVIGWHGWRRRALIVGTGESSKAIIRVIRSSLASHYNLVGCVADKAPGASKLALTVKTNLDPPDIIGVPILEHEHGLRGLVKQLNVSEIILATDDRPTGQTGNPPYMMTEIIFHGLMDCYEIGVPIIPMPILYEQITGRVPVRHIGDHWATVLPMEPRSVFDPYPILKRLLDSILAIIGLIIFSMMLPFLAIIIYLDSQGSIFYRQIRVGRYGIPFEVWKLRSMIPDAEKYSGAKWASQADKRITRVGHFLRRTRLDELPQLINVIRGEMSFVGPRPERPVFVAELQQHIPFYRSRHVVLPGLTGWAQVNFRYSSSIEDALTKLQYDLYYIRHRSLSLDMTIMLKTIAVLLKMKGT